MKPIYDVFLSHSSADKPVVEEIALKLREAGIKPFLDKWHLVPGKLWQPGLEEGLRNSRACIVFVGSEGIGPLHRQEMLVAIDRGAKDPDFRVIPVLLPGSRKPTGIPDFLAQRTWVEFHRVEDEDAFQRLVRGIQQQAPGPSSREGGSAKSTYRCMAQLPEVWIHRREYDEVVEALCSKEGAQAGRSTGITIALRGVGGFGKTALAQQLCFNERVRKAYPDGILWAKMKEDTSEGERLSQVRDLIRWWIGEEPKAFEWILAAGAKLRESLGGEQALVVVDDVWSPEDVAPFQALGAGCALLITTQDNRTLPKAAKIIKVDSMAPDEAFELLRNDLPACSLEDCKPLAAELGECPLLLKLVNGLLRDMVKGGLSIAEALKEVKAALATEGFSAFTQEGSTSRHAEASRAILFSVRRLSEAEQRLFFQLAIFPGDEDIPTSVLERYWDVSHFGASKTCQRLHDLSLLLKFDRKSAAIRLHDVVRRVLIEEKSEDLVAFHSRLLGIYRPASGKWKDLAGEEIYLWRRLRDHFIGSGGRQEYKELLASFPFIQAKLLATDVNSVIGDYELFVEDQELQLIRDTLRLSAHILAKDSKQLASQFLGRLLELKESSLSTLIEGARSWRNGTWLRPRTGSLIQTGGALLRVLEGHAGGINTVAAIDSQRIISGSDDRTLQVWDLKSGQSLMTLEGHKAGINAVTVLGSSRAVSAAADETLRLWDLGNGQTIQIIQGHTAGGSAAAVVDSRRAILASGNTLRLWDVESGQILRTLQGNTAGIDAVAVIDSHCVLFASGSMLQRWNLDDGSICRVFPPQKSWIRTVSKVDSRHVVVVYDTGAFQLLNFETGESLKSVGERQTDTVTAKAVSVSIAMLMGRCVVYAAFSQTPQVWNLERGQSLQPLEGHTNWVRAVAVVDDRRVISASNDGTLRLWDLDSRHTLQTFQGHTDKINSVAVVDRRYVVSASKDWTLRMWDLECNQVLQTPRAHMDRVNAVVVTEDHHVVSASRSLSGYPPPGRQDFRQIRPGVGSWNDRWFCLDGEPWREVETDRPPSGSLGAPAATE